MLLEPDMPLVLEGVLVVSVLLDVVPLDVVPLDMVPLELVVSVLVPEAVPLVLGVVPDRLEDPVVPLVVDVSVLVPVVPVPDVLVPLADSVVVAVPDAGPKFELLVVAGVLVPEDVVAPGDWVCWFGPSAVPVAVWA